MRAGQAQKEFFVNEGLARLDALVQPVVSGTAAAPPASPTAGESWIVDTGATGAWEGRDESLAYWDGGQWSFQLPFPGLQVFDLSSDRLRTYHAGWDNALEPVGPAGGSVVDSEARATLEAILEVLRAHRIIANI
jgi:hypothetical protein